MLVLVFKSVFIGHAPACLPFGLKYSLIKPVQIIIDNSLGRFPKRVFFIGAYLHGVAVRFEIVQAHQMRSPVLLVGLTQLPVNPRVATIVTPESAATVE